MNRAILIGRLAKEVTTNEDNSRSSFTIAVNGYGDHTDFINIVAWKKTAELAANYLHKGDRVGISGRITSRTYETTNGIKRVITEVVADELEFLQNKRDELKVEEINDEELPF